MKRSIKHWYQRITRGWDDSETWNLDISLAVLILPRLKKFKELNMGYPNDLSVKEWEEILDKMINSFEMIKTEDYLYHHSKLSEVQEGLDLFGKYYMALWW